MENQALVLDLLDWLADQPQSYTKVMEAWRTTCPRLTIWEDALDAGLVRVQYQPQATPLVYITSQGEDFRKVDRRIRAGCPAV